MSRRSVNVQRSFARSAPRRDAGRQSADRGRSRHEMQPGRNQIPMQSAGERSSDLSRSLGAEQQEQEHASIVLIEDAGRTTRRRGSPEYRGLTRVPCRRDDQRWRRDSPSGVAPSTQREQGNEDNDETEVPGVADAVVFGTRPQGTRWGHDSVTPRDEPTRFSHAAPPTAQGKQLSRSASTAARQSVHYSEHDRRAPQRHGFSVSRARNTQLFLTTSPFSTERDARQDGEHMECQAHREATRHHARGGRN